MPHADRVPYDPMPAWRQVGIGLRAPHYRELLATDARIGCEQFAVVRCPQTDADLAPGGHGVVRNSVGMGHGGHSSGGSAGRF